MRTLPQYHPWNKHKTWEGILDELGADIACFQEVKVQRSFLDRRSAVPDHYDSFFSLPMSKGGYSGVAVYTNSRTVVPLKAEEGLTGKLQPKPSLHDDERISRTYPHFDDFELMPDEQGMTPNDLMDLDCEGRALVLDFGLFVLINLYCPAETVETRLPFKMNFHRLLQERVRILIEKEHREVIVVGDINICAQPLDHVEYTSPNAQRDFWERPPRAWFRDWLEPNGPFADVIRRCWPDRAGMYTCWNTRVSARDSNYGTRIDYILFTQGLLPWMNHGDIQASLKGSDHCPIYVDMYDEITTTLGTRVTLREAMKLDPELPAPPRISSRYWDEFSGKQTLLSNFFGKTKKPEAAVCEPDVPEDKPMPPVVSQSSSTSLDDVSTDALPQKPASTLQQPGSRMQAPKKPGQTKLSAFFRLPMASSTSQPSTSSSHTSPTSSLAAESSQSQIDADYELARRLAASESSKPGPSPSNSKSTWAQILAPLQAPNCTVHGEPAKQLTVTKPGPNKGKTFFICSRPLGPGYDAGKTKRLREEVDPQYRCDFFMWASDARKWTPKGAAKGDSHTIKRPRLLSAESATRVASDWES